MTLLIIIAAKYMIVVSAVLFIWCWYAAADRMQFLRTTLLVGAVALILSLAASSIYDNPRPFMVTGIAPLVAHDPGNGFPSDHALLTGTLAAIATMFNPYLGALLWLLALIVGAGRVLAGVHHTVDVLASFGIAIVSALVVHYALRHYTKPGK